MRRPEEPDPAQAREDLELIRRAKLGDREAIRALGGRLECVPRMVGAINRRRGGRMDSHGVQDVAQDALVLIWERLDGFRGDGALERWAYSFCHNAFMNHARRHARSSADTLIEEVDVPSNDEAPRLDFDDSFAMVESAVDELPPPDDDIVRLRNQDSLGFDAIGSRVGLPVNTTKTRYYRALARLRETLAPRLAGGTL